ncbi:response regulator [Rickettsiales endosymbiont of Peranema trichophorum]|nr:response regulator [Rickettsiales endosymbiont of Peranema trichophorum]
MTPSILLVEDEKTVSDLIKYNLQKAGYHIQVTASPTDAIYMATNFKPDLIILDWMLMDKMSGIDVCMHIREAADTQNIPIIMVSGKSEDHDRIVGLNVGADDYLTKPFTQSELIARIKAVLRRLRPAFSGKQMQFQDIVMNISSRTVTREGGKVVKLSPIEFKLLQILMEHPGRVLSREIIMDMIWGTDFYVGPRTVDVHMTRLRKTLLSQSPDGIDVIQTVRLYGYTMKVDDPQTNGDGNAQR